MKYLFFPSTENNSVNRSTFLPFDFANTPTAVLQSPSRTFKTSLSAFATVLVSWSLMFSSNFLISLSSSLHWIAIIPWPAQGISSSTLNSCEILCCKFKASTPAFERIIASYSPFSNFWTLVSTFPLISLYFKLGLFFLSWYSRLYDDVPIIEFGSKSSNFIFFLIIKIYLL